ncbi:hypothetical protein P691DRAFT_611908, partial [Macrolepiota fuliginosa MF-IS2]
GQRICAAVIPLISDLPTAKKLAVFMSATAKNFCSHCYLTYDQIHDLNFHNWKLWSWEEHLMNAYVWKKASTKEEQNDIFGAYGVRWSKLLHLPYWDPTSYIVIDSMHCFYLGLFHHHAVHIWGMDAAKDDG